MRFITCRLPDGVEDPAILSEDGRQVWPLSWLGLSYETLSEAIPFLTPQVRYGLSLAIAGIPALPVEAVALESPIPAPAQDVICLGINYMAHSDEAEKYSAAAFATQHQDAIYFSKRVTRAVPDGGPIEAHTDLVKKLDYECELAVVLGKDARDVPAGQTRDYVFGYTILNDVSARDVQTAHKQWLGIPAAYGQAPETGKTLDILFSHDTHSHLNTFTTVVDEKEAEIGGFARANTLIKAQRAKDPDTLVIDGGDFSMARPCLKRRLQSCGCWATWATM